VGGLEQTQLGSKKEAPFNEMRRLHNKPSRKGILMRSRLPFALRFEGGGGGKRNSRAEDVRGFMKGVEECVHGSAVHP